MNVKEEQSGIHRGGSMTTSVLHLSAFLRLCGEMALQS